MPKHNSKWSLIRKHDKPERTIASCRQKKTTAPIKSPLSKDRQQQQSCNTAHLLSWISNNNKAVTQRTPSIISKVHSDTNTPSQCVGIPDFYRLQTSMHAPEWKSDRIRRRGKRNWGWEGMTDRAIPTNPET